MYQVTVYNLDGTEYENYFGVCPKCGRSDGYINVSATHWFYCKEHKLRWWVGINLFSDWRYEAEEEQKRIYNELAFDSFEECDAAEAWGAACALNEAQCNRRPFTEAELEWFERD